MGTIFYKGKKYSSTDDYKVSQRGDITTNSNFELLLSTTADSDLTEIGELKKGKGLYYNPYSKELNVLNGSIIVGNPDSEAEDYGGVSITKTDILVKNGWFTEFGQDTSLKYCMGQLNTGKVSKSGDTMTGVLNMSDVNVVVKDTDIDTDVDPSSAVWGKGYYLTCTNDVSIGYLRAIKATDGKQGVQIETERYINGTRYFHNLNLRIGNDGTRYVEMADPAAWRSTLSCVYKAGDTMTGTLTFNKVTNAISYTGTKATYPMIKFIDNTADVNGNGIAIGGGGATIIGGGESATAMAGAVGSGGDEILYLGNDSHVYVFSNLQNGWADRKTFSFGSGGDFTAQNGLLKSTSNGNTVTIGSQNSSWCHIYNSASIGFYFNRKVVTSSEIFQSDGTNLQLCGKTDNAIIYLRGKQVEGKKLTTLTGYTPFYGSSFTNPSSRRIKENIKDLTNEDAEKILDINTVSFDFIDSWGDKNQYGVIAEDVEKIIPFVVMRSEDYDEDEPISPTNIPLSVDYAKFVPFLIKMVQIQQQEIEQLKERRN